MFQSHLKRFWIYYLFIILYISIVPIEILFRHFSFQTSGWDLGIYHQALSALSRFDDLNPYISMRMVYVFQDHFDIILLLIAPLIKVWNTAVTLIVLDQFFTFLGLLPILLITEKFLIENPSIHRSFFRFVVLSTYLFNDFLWSAIYFPSHPTHWAMAFISWICYFIYYHRFGVGFWISVVLLFSCKEEFPFLFLPITIILAHHKKYYQASIMTFIGFVWIAVILLRPIWLGPVSEYSSFLSLFFQSPAEYFSKFFQTIFTIEFALPFLILISYFSFPVKRYLNYYILLALLPFLLRSFCLKSTAFEYHYSAIFIPIILFHFIAALAVNPTKYKRFGYIYLFLLLIGQLFQSHPFQHPYSSVTKYFQNRQLYEQYDSLIDEIHDDHLIIAAPNNWLPHLTSNTNVRTISFCIDSSLTRDVDLWIWQGGGDYFPSTKSLNELRSEVHLNWSQEYVTKRFDNVELWIHPNVQIQMRPTTFTYLD